MIHEDVFVARVRRGFACGHFCAIFFIVILILLKLFTGIRMHDTQFLLNPWAWNTEKITKILDIRGFREINIDGDGKRKKKSVENAEYL